MRSAEAPVVVSVSCCERTALQHCGCAATALPSCSLCLRAMCERVPVGLVLMCICNLIPAYRNP